MFSKFLVLSAVTSTISFVLATQPATAQEWGWTAAPYIWAADVRMDLSLNGEPAIGVDVAFSDLVDKLDSAFMGHFEGRKGNWGFFVEVISISLRDGSVTPIGPGGPILGDLIVDSKLDMEVYEIGGMKRFSSPGSGNTVFDLLVGARMVDISVASNVTLPDPGMTMVSVDAGPSETDMMVGGRLTGEFSQKWRWLLRGDFSFGGTEGTFNSLAAIGYRFGQSQLFSLNLGYRYMTLDFEGSTGNGGMVDAKQTLSGPVLGFVFDF